MAGKSFAASLGALAAVLFGQAAATAEDYAFDLRKTHPAAFSAWARIVPATYRKNDWVSKLDGTTGPMEQVTMRGRVFFYGLVCQPHDCAGNDVAFLAAEDGSAAYGLLSSDNLGVKQRLLGAPDAEARQLLAAKLAQ